MNATRKRKETSQSLCFTFKVSCDVQLFGCRERRAHTAGVDGCRFKPIFSTIHYFLHRYIITYTYRFLWLLVFSSSNVSLQLARLDTHPLTAGELQKINCFVFSPFFLFKDGPKARLVVFSLCKYTLLLLRRRRRRWG